MEGLFSYFPKLRDEIDVQKLEFPRPRKAIVAVLGEEIQGCPTLVLADPTKATNHGLPVKEANGRTYMDDEKSIMRYLSLNYGVSRPAHD
ncbi:MAG: DUF3088 domain-containing protein [Pseudodesulfovibrio sp.]